MQLDLKRAIEAVGKEKNIDKQLLIGALREALLSAARKHYGECVFETRFNEETEEIELIRYRIVIADTEASIWDVINGKSAKHDEMKRRMAASMKEAQSSATRRVKYDRPLDLAFPAWIKSEAAA